MKATLWLWSAVTALVCASLQVSALPYSDSRVIQENSLLSLKRTKPSLSIVNPLDVLRQRIILEMARRQMRENTRQVELNKALLREIGKRSSNFYDRPEDALDYAYYDRKPYNHRVAPEPEHSPVEEELEAMVESLLRGGHLSLREGNHQRVRSIADRQLSPLGHAKLEQTSQLASRSPQQPPQQLGSLFTDEQDPDQAKNGGYQQPNTGSNDNDGPVDEDGEEALGGGSSAALKEPAPDGYLEQAGPAGPGKIESQQATGNDRNAETDFRQRYVYGMYKNRYAN
ncbi:uncharacterized protein LOC131284258 [Anopheles ziemanni]|uniref:uncharacterized protein LOC131272185 n=1 Tax=Anopheles coustani TaxID=139045 RepID=UPI00265B43DA|nr:uncharacterized protein LOC131272185 [Anopheles coustani]XP_058169095.1 uncharacterized protein LOC131284258 [Anopheles ziemanni]